MKNKWTYICKCGCTDMFIEKVGNNIGLYCKSCGKWQKWLNKNEVRVFENEQKEKEMPIINGNLKNITNINIDNLDIVKNLNEFIDFLDKEIDRQLTRKALSVEDNLYKCANAHAYELTKESLINIVNGRRYDEYEE